MGGEDFLGIGEKKAKEAGTHGHVWGLQMLNREWGKGLVKSLGPDYAGLKSRVKEFGLCSTGSGVPLEIIFLAGEWNA